MSHLQRLSLILFKVLLAITLDYIRSGLLVLLRACSLIFSLSSIHHCSSYLSIITVCFLNKYGVAQVLYRSNLSLCEELAELVPHLQRDGKQLPVLASTVPHQRMQGIRLMKGMEPDQVCLSGSNMGRLEKPALLFCMKKVFMCGQ